MSSKKSYSEKAVKRYQLVLNVKLWSDLTRAVLISALLDTARSGRRPIAICRASPWSTRRCIVPRSRHRDPGATSFTVTLPKMGLPDVTSWRKRLVSRADQSQLTYPHVNQHFYLNFFNILFQVTTKLVLLIVLGETEAEAENLWIDQ